MQGGVLLPTEAVVLCLVVMGATIGLLLLWVFDNSLDVIISGKVQQRRSFRRLIATGLMVIIVLSSVRIAWLLWKG